MNCGENGPVSLVPNSTTNVVTTPPFVRSKSAHLMSSLNRISKGLQTAQQQPPSVSFVQKTANQRILLPSSSSKIIHPACDTTPSSSPTKSNPKVEGTCQTDDAATGWRRHLKSSTKRSNDLGQHRSRFCKIL